MKKNYQKPALDVIRIGYASQLLKSSFTDIGGSTEEFDSKKNPLLFEDDEYLLYK